MTVLINNAGIVTGKKLDQLTDEMIERTFNVNAVSHFWVGKRQRETETEKEEEGINNVSSLQTIKSFLPDMISKNHGHIITIASGAGLFGVPGLVDYCSSKFAAVGTHSSLTLELEANNNAGVHATVVCPYFIDTGMFDGVKSK